jgi:soluble lytic murein transglycosylase-like protein
MNTSKLSGSLATRYGRFLAVLHHAFAWVGLVSITFFMYQGAQRHFAPPVASSPQQPEHSETRTHLERVADEAGHPGQRALAGYLARRYRVATDAAEQLVAIAFGAGRQVGVDPLLILAVMAIESRLNPIAESGMGAKGLMQIIPKHHQDKLQDHGGEQALLNPVTNVLVGTQILKEYIRRSGSLEAGLQWYNGAPLDESSQYAEKVIAEQQRLRQASSRVERPAAKPSSV